VSRYEWLLFLHVTGAFAVLATVALYGAAVLGPPQAVGGFLRLGNVLFSIGAVLTLAFGIWLAIDDERYHPWDGWIIAAYVLWGAAGAVEQRFRRSLDVTTSAEARDRRRAARTTYGLLAAIVVLFVVLMITKPGG
jgi:hypothetical protein